MQQRVGVLLATLLTLVTTACAADDARLTIHTATRALTVAIEVADTDERRRRGLMYRNELGDGDGMLFVFPETADHAFWMKNTFIPLDMIFIDDGLRIVGIHPDARPMSSDRIAVGVPSRYVLEVPGGWAARHAVRVGARVELRGVAAP